MVLRWKKRLCRHMNVEPSVERPGQRYRQNRPGARRRESMPVALLQASPGDTVDQLSLVAAQQP